MRKRKNLVLGLAAVAVTAFSISACGGGGSATPTVTVTKEAAPTQTSQPEPEYESNMTFDPSGYLAYLRMKDSAFRLVDDDTAVETGNSVCLALGTGNSVDSIILKAIDAGLTSNQAAALIVGAVLYLCPQYEDDVRTQVQSF